MAKRKINPKQIDDIYIFEVTAQFLLDYLLWTFIFHFLNMQKVLRFLVDIGRSTNFIITISLITARWFKNKTGLNYL